ncbi:MAG: thioredoxin-disulfide reductase [Rickettsiales bacterium]|jgi:thioredoxin reductase (NADPH)|nr:thioredoxin-disulfide reductase [Rickettsiales bacterium]
MKNYDVLIIGSGPAGDTAAIYAVRSGFTTVILTGLNVGGQLTITTDIENFPGFPEPIKGLELMNRTLEQCKNLGIDIIYDTVKDVDFSSKPFICKSENGDIYGANNIVIATGARAKWLGLESEKKFLGHGVSGCATCDGNFFRNKPVAVVGGGDTAGTEALHMSHIASEVYLIYRKSSLMRMQDSLAKEVLNNNKIKILFDSEVLEICGSEQPRAVEYLKIVNNKTQNVSKIDVSAVFVAIGRKPESDIFVGTGLNIDDNGYIVTKEGSARTNIQNIYAAGDVTNGKFKQAILAAGYGCVAALEIEEDSKYTQKDSELRKAIGTIILDAEGKIIVFRRTDFPSSWQCPEGGIEKDEQPIDALYREVKEEIGLDRDDFEILSETKDFISYTYAKSNSFPWGGQQKKFFLLKLNKNDKKFKYDNVPDCIEFSGYKSVTGEEFLKLAPAFKENLYETVLREFNLWHEK